MRFPARLATTRLSPLFGLALGIFATPGMAQEDLEQADTWLQRETLTGNWGGTRDVLSQRGVTLAATYIGDAYGNPIGGVRQGAAYLGWLEMMLDLDLDKAVGWAGAAFHAHAYQIHGRGLTSGRVGNLLTLTDVEATPATRLSTLWLEQSLFDDRVSVRLGKLAADDEFLISNYAVPLPNSTFGWPAITGLDLPSGGPAYPFAAPGVRVSAAPTDQLSVMAAIFSGDPAGPGDGDPQRRNASGTGFRLQGGAFAIAELAYAVNQQGERTSGDGGGGGLPATYRIGGWYHSGRFQDQRRDDLGLSLADPASSGVPAARRSNVGAYAVMDRMVWRRPGTDHGLGIFLRLAGSPADRNLIDFYVDAGFGYKGLIPGRQDDTVTLGFAYARVSEEARRRDRDLREFTGTAVPVRDFEAVLELTYQAPLAPWLTVQPDLQFVFHPGGGAANPSDAAGTKAIPDAVVLGLRTAIRL